MVPGPCGLSPGLFSGKEPFEMTGTAGQDRASQENEERVEVAAAPGPGHRTSGSTPPGRGVTRCAAAHPRSSACRWQCGGRGTQAGGRRRGPRGPTGASACLAAPGPPAGKVDACPAFSNLTRHVTGTQIKSQRVPSIPEAPAGLCSQARTPRGWATLTAACSRAIASPASAGRAPRGPRRQRWRFLRPPSRSIKIA